jgi:hypothetical protein
MQRRTDPGNATFRQVWLKLHTDLPGAIRWPIVREMAWLDGLIACFEPEGLYSWPLYL